MHPDDAAVDAFAELMKDKMAKSRAKGREGWEECPEAKLVDMLFGHITKGDMRDVANLAMMIHFNRMNAGVTHPQPISYRVWVIRANDAVEGVVLTNEDDAEEVMKRLKAHARTRFSSYYSMRPKMYWRVHDYPLFINWPEGNDGQILQGSDGGTGGVHSDPRAKVGPGIRGDDVGPSPASQRPAGTPQGRVVAQGLQDTAPEILAGGPCDVDTQAARRGWLGEFLDPDDLYPHLKGKTAIVVPHLRPDGATVQDGVVKAQFDDLQLPEAHGWHEFHISSFKLDSE